MTKFNIRIISDTVCPWCYVGHKRLQTAIKIRRRDHPLDSFNIIYSPYYLNPSAPKVGIERARLQQWLCFIGTELHKGLFIPLFDKKAPEGTAANTLAKGESRLAYLNDYLTGREFLLDTFSVADAYLYTVLNWSRATPVKFDRFPAIDGYFKRLQKRPSVAKAFSEELALYKAEMARHKAAA